jgi:hypothetical protein
MHANVSFIDSFEDLGPHGTGRHMDHMLPEIPRQDFRKGAQWFTMKRQHAVIVMADGLYYSKFREYCRVSSVFLYTKVFVCMLQPTIYD